MKLIALVVVASLPISASDSSIVKVAAGTTIAVNALEIKDRIRQAKAAMKATKKTVQKIGKKIAGK